MSEINDGGAAFPLPNSTHINGDFIWGNFGMSLRAYMATKIMAAQVSAMDGLEGNDMDFWASMSIEGADALIRALAARERKA
jgi:hypothetical protein